MYRTRLLSLKIHNFKGIKDLQVVFLGANCEITGKNASGKTSIVDAYLWLINGKSYEQGRNIDEIIKHIDENGNPVVDNGEEHTVEMTMDCNGTQKTFKKAFQEVWKKVRGSASKSFSGHKTTYFLDGMSCTKSVYDKELKSIHGDVLPMLARPQTFTEMETKKKRKLLMQIVGEGKKIEYPENVQKYLNTYGDLNSSLDAVNKQLSGINNQLDEIPVRIDEIKKSMPEKIETGGLKEKLDSLNADKEKLRMKISTYSVDDKVAELEVTCRRKQNEAENTKKLIATLQDNQRQKIAASLASAQDRKKTLVNQLSYEQSRLQANSEIKDEMLAKWVAVKKSEYSGSDTCPTCGQKLPVDMIDKAKENFNLGKAEKLKSIGDRGKKLNQLMQESYKKIKELEEEIAKADTDIAKYQEEAKKPVESTKEILELNTKLVGLNNEIQELVKKMQDYAESDIKAGDDKGNLINAMHAIDAEIEEKMGVLAKAKLYNDMQKRTDDLKKQQKALSVQYDGLISIKMEMENIIKEIVDDMKTRIAEKFKFARFSMYQPQINGGIKECCEVLDKDGIPIDRASNHASRVNTNIDIVDALSRFYDVSAPVFVDNCESVNNVLDGGINQMILLTVSNDALQIESNLKGVCITRGE